MGVSLNPASILSGQGFDVSSVVQQILSEQSGPLTVWQNQEATLQSQSIALTAINNDLGHLATAVQALSDPVGVFVSQTAASSQPSILTATAQTSAAAATHKITVTGFATPGHPENQRVGNVAGMQVEEVGRAVVGFEHSQVLRAEMRVRLLARKDRKEKRQVGVVRIEEIQLAQVERVVAGHGGEIGVKLVISLRKKIAVRVGENSSKLGYKVIKVR